MAEVIDIGWIQSKKTSTYHIKLIHSASTGLVVDMTQQDFKFVISPTQHGPYGLIANNSLTHVMKATDTKDLIDRNARIVQVVSKPSGVTAGTDLPAGLDDKLLFSIDRDGDKFRIKSKYLSTSLSTTYVLHILGGAASSGAKVVAYGDSSATHQRWTFKSQQPSTALKKFCTKSTTISKPANATEVSAVSPQDQSVSDASPNIIDGKWVPVVMGRNGMVEAGTGKCYKFIMEQVRGSASSNFKKDRCELCRCFTRLSDLSGTRVAEIANLTTCKYIYSLSNSETRCNQGSSKSYSFKINVPSWQGTRNAVNVIFAQWHGMPSSLFFKIPQPASTPTAPLYTVDPKSAADAVLTWNTYGFKQGVSTRNHTTSSTVTQYHYVEQGGKPPLAIKFKNDKLQVAINGDARYFSDKYDPGTNTKLRGTITGVYEGTHDLMPSLNSFPLNKWVTFEIKVKWAAYTIPSPGSSAITVPTNGTLEIKVKDGSTVLASLPPMTGLNIGRNDSLGYYFKFGCYRHSTEGVEFLLKDYTET